MSDAKLNAAKHGHCSDGVESKTYKSWKAMKRRCRNGNGKHAKNYALKGVSFDPSWEKFDAFLLDMGERPSGTTLDRIDNEKGYYKENCRWATSDTQNRNRRNVVLSEDKAKQVFLRAMAGESQNVIASEFGCSPQLVSNIKTGKAWANVNK